MREIVDCWNDKADQWKNWVGKNGDKNRIFNSDPVLWQFVGDVQGKKVLDAGCGTGYLSLQFSQKGATVVGVDLSDKMIDLANAEAKESNQAVKFAVDSCSELLTVEDQSIDVVVSNYVLMDVPDFRGAVKAFYRVLKPNGKAVLVFSHPCFNQFAEGEMYFDEIKKAETWGPFQSDFIFFHRPLSEYWKTFVSAGFQVVQFDEPVAKDPTVPGFKQEWLSTYRKRPWSVAFELRK